MVNKTYTSSLSYIVVAVCSFRFLLDGITFSFFGHSMEFGHVDPYAYASLLTPVLAAHGYVKTRKDTFELDFMSKGNRFGRGSGRGKISDR